MEDEFALLSLRRYVIIKHKGDNMIRTQVTLDEKDYTLAKREARTLGVSVAEFVRRSLRDSLPSVTGDRNDAWMRYAGFVESGDAESSRHIDDIVYGAKD